VLVLPAHERPFHGLHTRLTQLREHHLRHLDQVLERCAQPCTAAELMVELFPRLKSRFDELMAIGETLAHTNYLIGRRAAGARNGSGRAPLSTPPAPKRRLASFLVLFDDEYSHAPPGNSTRPVGLH